MISYPQEVHDALILSQNKFTWEVPSHERYERGTNWYMILSLITIAFIAYAVYTANFLFAFIILLIAMLLILTGHKEPKRVLVQIGDQGVVIDGHLKLFQDLENFSIIYQPPTTSVLYIEHRSSLKPRMRIPLHEENPVELRAHLRQFVRENMELQEEYLSDILARLLKI